MLANIDGCGHATSADHRGQPARAVFLQRLAHHPGMRRLLVLILASVCVACSNSEPEKTVGTAPKEGLAQPILTIHRVGDRTLELTYRRATCQEAAGHVIRYQHKAITITMYTLQDKTLAGCVGGIGTQKATLHLDQKIGSRKLIDGACAKGQVMANSSDCRSGFTST